MTEQLSVNIQRWPKKENGGGVFANPAQMAEALSDLHDQHGYRGTLSVGDGVKLADTYFLEMARGDELGVRADIGQLLVYYLDILRAVDAEQYETMSGQQP